MLTLWIRKYFILLSISSKFIKGHKRSLFNPWLTLLWTTFILFLYIDQPSDYSTINLFLWTDVTLIIVGLQFFQPIKISELNLELTNRSLHGGLVIGSLHLYLSQRRVERRGIRGICPWWDKIEGKYAPL